MTIITNDGEFVYDCTIHCEYVNYFSLRGIKRYRNLLNKEWSSCLTHFLEDKIIWVIK